MVADAIKLVSNDGEDLTYVHSNHLGAAQKMTDNDRSVVWDSSFLPFGEEDSIVGSAANDNRFPGQRLEAETGLHYNYFRDYDPTTGRYLQSDPIGLAGGINTYGYVSGNPVNYVDPKGKIALADDLLLFGGLAAITACIAIDCTKPIGDALNGWYNDLLTHKNENSENDEDAKQCKAPELEKSRKRGVPESDIGPSGKPKIKGKKHPSKKRAKEAARNAGKGNPEHHPSPKRGRPHYHPVDTNGNKLRPHHYY